MTDHALAEWLLENAGPVIRYRTAAELMDRPADFDLKRLAQELLESPQVRLWLDRLKPGRRRGHLHGSQNTAFENVMGKLLEFGLRAGMPILDERILPFLRWLAAEVKEAPKAFGNMLVASALARAGYGDEPLRTFLCHRLDVLYETARKGTYDIYIDPRAYSDIPKAPQGRPLINPELDPGGDFKLPWIHDIYALSHFPSDLADAKVKKKISAVIEYVLDPKYQALHQGYGIFRAGKGRYYSMGWSAHLPGYHGFDLSDWEAGHFVQRVELMAHFPAARRHRWFQECLKHLESHRTENGTFLFPRRYLKELQQGYWVTGAHMGLEENRRSTRAIEIESTFRMLKIKRLAGI